MSRPTISSFDDLVRIASVEPDPPLLLTLLVRSEPVHAGDEDAPPRALEGEGILKPIRAKFHAVHPTTNFAALAAEADEQDDRWAFMMTAVLPGQNGSPPSKDEADETLRMMARTLLTGGDLQRFIFFDRNGEPVRMGSPVDTVRSGAVQ